MAGAVGALASKCTKTPFNMEVVPETVRLAVEMGASGASISRVYPMGRALRWLKQLTVRWEDFMSTVRRVYQEAPAEFIVNVECIPLRHYFDDEYRRQLERERQDQKNLSWNGCFAGVLTAHIEADGSVLPCAFFALPAGNVHTRRFREIWTGARLMQDLRRRDHLKGACGTCEYKYACGGCRGRALGLFGDYLAEDPLCPKSAFAFRSRNIQTSYATYRES